MRTTIDLPDDLLRLAKIAAVNRGATLRDLVAIALRRELSLPASAAAGSSGLPAVQLNDDAPVLRLSPSQISLAMHRADAEDDAARAG